MTATSNFRPRWILLALVFLGMPYTGAIAAGSSPLMDYLQNPNPQQWPQYCAKIKAKLSKSPATFLTFTPLPKLSPNIAPVWKLNWHGLAIPVPVARYTKIVLFSWPAVFNILALATDNYQQSFSATIGLNNHQGKNPQRSPDKKGTSEESRGNYDNLVEYLTRALTITPESLSCSTENVRQQVLDAMALQSKQSLSSPVQSPVLLKTYAMAVHVIAAHRVESSSTGILEEGRTSSNDAIYAYFLHHESDFRLYIARYQFSRSRPDLLNASLLLAEPTAAVYTNAPAWFQQLQTWLDKPTQTHWCALLSALKQARFDDKNLQRLAKQHPACPSP